jgi:hypothetical protein
MKRPDYVMRFALVVGFLVAVHRPADACSVTKTFIAPSNFELVATTPRIVIAKAIGAVIPKTRGDDHAIELEITGVIKGAGKIGEKLFVRGATMRYMGASPKNDFSRARKGAYAGSCTAWDYKLDKHYLVFLVEHRGEWHTRGTPFTRVNEEVDAKNDPWTIAVTAYAKIADLPKLEDRKKALDALAAKGAQKGASATDKAIADDIARHFEAATPFKTFAELDVMFRAAPADRRNQIVLAIGTSGDQAAREFMKGIVTSLRAGTPSVDEHIALTAIGAYYKKVSDPPVLSQIAELYVALGTKAKQSRWDIMWLLINRADASHQALMERALAGADDEEAGRLVEFFTKSPSETARKEVRKRIGTAWGEKWEMTIGIAGMGDKDVIAWAKKTAAEAKTKDDKRWVAIYAIAMSPLPEADALATGIIAKGGEDLVTLIQGYQKARHAKVDARLAEIGKKKLEAEAKKWLDRTIDERKNPYEP